MYQVYKFKSAVCLKVAVSAQSYSGHTTHFFLCLTLTSAHHQQFHTTTYIFSFVIMSSFLLKKSTCGKLCFSVSIWRNRLPNRNKCLWRPCGDNALSETTCRDWFRRFNDDNFDLSDKKRENLSRKVEDCQLHSV